LHSCNVRYWPKADMPFYTDMSAFGGKADMTQSWQTRLGVTPRHNYLVSIRGKGIECPRTLARLKGCPALPPSKGSLFFC
jgi:hypothetical protein